MVKIAVIGTGFARRIQMPALKKCGAEFVSVCSGTIENARSTAEEFGAQHFTDDWRETVSHPNAELVLITSPPFLHHAQAIAATENGKHILCEKPMAMTVAEAEEMAAKAKEKGVLALIDHELRFQDGRRKAFEMIRSGKIGKIRHFHASFKAPHRGMPDLPWTWWSDAEKGGGVLGASTSHQLDNMFWFTDTHVETVSAVLSIHVRERADSDAKMRAVTSDDAARLLIKLADGEFTCSATAVINSTVTEANDFENVVEVFGEHGSLKINAIGELFHADGIEDWNQISCDLSENIGGLFDSGFARGFMRFAPKIIAAIKKRDNFIEHAATFEDGLRVQEILDAARRSSAEICTVKL